METARPEIPRVQEIPGVRELPSIRRLARQLITEFGEQAAAMARTNAQKSVHADEAQTWLRVLDAVNSLSPGGPPKS